MRLWIESAQESLAGGANEVADNRASTLITEERFAGFVVGGALGPEVGLCAAEAVQELIHGAAFEPIVDKLLGTLPRGKHAPLALLCVFGGDHARLVECDAPPLFMARRGRLVLLPVIEEENAGHLIRRCEFTLRDGDHLALVSEGYIEGIRAGKLSSSVGWRELAAAVRRLTDTRCDAGQLAGALMRQYERLAGGEAGSRQSENSAIEQETPLPAAIGQYPVSVLAMFVRPIRTLTIWSGPPASRAAERGVLDALMGEEDMRVVCGDTTAEIAARLLGGALVMEPRPPEGWGEVPPISRMVLPDGSEAVTLVTEGVVTMRVARDRLARVTRARELAGRGDGASRLAHLLLTADRIRFLIGLAVNPAQVSADGTPLRWAEVEELTDDLRVRGKIVSVERF